METDEITMDEASRSCTIQPADHVTRHSMRRVLYLTANGDGGKISRAIVLFNPRNGAFQIRNVDRSAKPRPKPKLCDFDMPDGAETPDDKKK
jgi:hypothetical protein